MSEEEKEVRTVMSDGSVLTTIQGKDMLFIKAIEFPTSPLRPTFKGSHCPHCGKGINE